MNCLKIDEIYAYLEGELGPSRSKDIKSHLIICPKCQAAVTERSLLAEAASGLPDLDIPPDFIRRVMARIAPQTFSLPVWLTASIIGSSFLGMLSVLLLVSGGRSALAIVGSFSHSFWAYFKNATVLIAKMMAVISLAGEIVRPLARTFYKGLSLLPTLISPQAQILLITLSLVAFITLFYIVKKKFWLGEKI